MNIEVNTDPNNLNIIEEEDEQSPVIVNDTVPKLVSINTKLYVLLILLIIFAILQGFWINSANERAELNSELMYVKMYPNGTWDVEYRNNGSEADFFPLTIDKLLQDYVVARHGVIPATIRRDYGFSLIFMSEQLAATFIGTGPKDFNAKKKAEELSAKGHTEEINIRFVDHYDVSEGVYLRGNSDIYRSNIFIERVVRNSSGNIQSPPVNEVVNLHWRIKSIKELSRYTRDQLRANPIGIEILKDKINLDYSSTKTNKG